MTVNDTRLYTRCLRCGRKLKNIEHMKIGFGPSCYKKISNSRLKKKPILLQGVENDRKAATVGYRKHELGV